MTGPDARVIGELQQAVAELGQGRLDTARSRLEALAIAAPASADVRRLLAAARAGQGDAAGAEEELRTALRLSRGHGPALVDLARLLAAAGRHDEVVQLTEQAAQLPTPPDGLLDERARALQALERWPETRALRERQVRMRPDSMVAEHNLAAVLGDMGLAAEAEAAAGRAFVKGGDAPETWLVLARALQAQNRFDEAEAAYVAAIDRRPRYVDALREHAQLVWMRTGDVVAASRRLDAALRAHPDAAVRAVRARLYEYAGLPEQAYAGLIEAQGRDDPAIETAAAAVAVRLDPARALDHARRAVALAPADEGARRVLVDALMADGRAAEAASEVEALLARHPHDQALLAAQATVWRLLDDPRARSLLDYEAFVGAARIDTPPGWSSLEDYLGDLAAALRRLHQLRTHPLDQSLRHGTQTSADLLHSEDPAIRAFFTAIDGPIRRHLARLGRGDGPLRSRNTGEYRIKGSWSVLLRPNGFHADHLHSGGWLSSACYIELPSSIDSPGREGWIKFGQPGGPTRPALEPEHFIRPEPGLLALFPSYMWHGTVPFSGEDTRLTIAFDVVPA